MSAVFYCAFCFIITAIYLPIIVDLQFANQNQNLS